MTETREPTSFASPRVDWADAIWRYSPSRRASTYGQFGVFVLVRDGGQAAEQLGLLLIPALACDGAGIRLGYGGGWYDRLRADPTWAQVPALAVLPRGCRVERLPRDPWDVPLQGWIDEDGLGHPS